MHNRFFSGHNGESKKISIRRFLPKNLAFFQLFVQLVVLGCVVAGEVTDGFPMNFTNPFTEDECIPAWQFNSKTGMWAPSETPTNASVARDSVCEMKKKNPPLAMRITISPIRAILHAIGDFFCRMRAGLVQWIDSLFSGKNFSGDRDWVSALREATVL
jgi:hypothetical protein